MAKKKLKSFMVSTLKGTHLGDCDERSIFLTAMKKKMKYRTWATLRCSEYCLIFSSGSVWYGGAQIVQQFGSFVKVLHIYIIDLIIITLSNSARLLFFSFLYFQIYVFSSNLDILFSNVFQISGEVYAKNSARWWVPVQT